MVRQITVPHVEIESYETHMKWPTACAIGAAGVALAKAQMLQNQVLPCTPEIDIGFDVVTVFNAVLKRVQIKATQQLVRNSVDSVTFCVNKRKAGFSRDGTYMHSTARSYSIDEFDAFIFVHNLQHRFFVVPTSELDVSRHKITFTPDSEWADAWWVLKKS